MKLEEQISKLIMTIQVDYPELSKYILEMPVNNSDEVSSTSLENYRQSLEELIRQYAKTHLIQDKS